MIAQGISERKSLSEDFFDIPRGESGRQLLENLNRNVVHITSSLDVLSRQANQLDTRLGYEVSSLASSLQENIVKCSSTYAPHEEQLMQLDGAKRRLKELTRLLEAREIFDTSDDRLSLSERLVDDSLLPTLVAIGENLKVFKSVGAMPKFDVEAYHKAKDRYLTWKGTEFAVKFGSPDGLDDIFDAFNALNSLEDFYRLYQHHFDRSLSALADVQRVSESSMKELGGNFVPRAGEHFRSHVISLCKYCDDQKAFSTLLFAWKNFVSSGGLTKVLDIVMDNYASCNILDDLNKLVVNVRKTFEADNQGEELSEAPENIDRIILDGFLQCSIEPISKKLFTMAEPPPLNFRSTSDVSMSIEKFGFLLQEVSLQIRPVYSEKQGVEVVSKILKPIFTNYVGRLAKMEDNTHKGTVRVEEYLERLNLVGQMLKILKAYKKDTGVESGSEVKQARKWMSERVKDAVKASHRLVTDRMPSNADEVYKEEGAVPKSTMPTPQDYVVTATQNLLHLLRLWEECLSNPNARLAVAVFVAEQDFTEDEKNQSIDEESIFAAVLDRIASHVVKKFLNAVNQFVTPNVVISRGLLREILCDSEYLRDALIDLRAGTHQNLDDKIEELRKNVDSSTFSPQFSPSSK